VSAEAEAAIAAVAGATGARDAIDRFVRAIVAHHLADLGRFRVTYLVAQVSPKADLILPREASLNHVHPVSGRMYGALAERLAADPALPKALDPRRAAVIAHTSALGLVTLLSLADAVDDPLAHPTDALVETLVAMLAR